jgi:hypothetical protein
MKEKGTTCWSCGGKNGYHFPGCEDQTGITVHPPDNPPPHCGQINKKCRGVIEILINLNNNKIEKHYCCECHKPYTATYTDWITGTCPHCGAKGLG